MGCVASTPAAAVGYELSEKEAAELAVLEPHEEVCVMCMCFAVYVDGVGGVGAAVRAAVGLDGRFGRAVPCPPAVFGLWGTSHLDHRLNPSTTTKQTQSFMEQHALNLCADAGPSAGGPPRLLLTRIMAISVGSATRYVSIWIHVCGIGIGIIKHL